MARLGVIDLGSNSVRLVVYETKREDAAKPFRTLVDEKKMAGLAAYVTDGALSNAGIARAVAVLGDLLKLADNLNCARVDDLRHRRAAQLREFRSGNRGHRDSHQP